jgi:hypothetical protein
MGEVMSIEAWKQNHNVPNNICILSEERDMQTIEKITSVDLLPVSPQVKANFINTSIYNAPTLHICEIKRNFGNAIKYGTLAFEQQMRELFKAYPIEKRDIRLFEIDRLRKELLVLSMIKEIMIYLYTVSREDCTRCVFEIGSPIKIDEKMLKTIDEDPSLLPKYYQDILTNYSTVSALERGDMKVFDKLVVSKVKEKGR